MVTSGSEKPAVAVTAVIYYILSNKNFYNNPNLPRKLRLKLWQNGDWRRLQTFSATQEDRNVGSEISCRGDWQDSNIAPRIVIRLSTKHVASVC